MHTFSITIEGILLFKLKKNEKLKLFGYTKQGIGEEHAKFDVCCRASYKLINKETSLYELSIETNGNYTAKEVYLMSLDILKKNLLFYRNLK